VSSFLAHDARTLCLARGGHWHGRYGTASCPVCQPEGRSDQDALTISDGAKGILLHCKKSKCNFRDMLVGLGIQPGRVTAPDPSIMAKRVAAAVAEADKHARLARMLWDESIPIHGTVAEVYLRGRGITCALLETLRFHPECWHREARRCLPAMVGRVDGAERFGIHRTYLRPDGSGKAEVKPEKAMLGAVQGGAIRLTRNGWPLVVAEGVETAASLACGLLDGPVTIWAALTTSGMAGLRLPDEPGRLIIASDGEEAGRKAAKTLEERAKAAGWCAEFFSPPLGMDWNDVLRFKQGI
jgi:hypothetical protein